MSFTAIYKGLCELKETMPWLMLHQQASLTSKRCFRNRNSELNLLFKVDFSAWKHKLNGTKVATEKVILISPPPPPYSIVCPHSVPFRWICFDFSLLCHSLMTGKSIGSWRQGWGRNWLPLLPLYLAWQFEAARNKHIIIPTTTTNNNNSQKKKGREQACWHQLLSVSSDYVCVRQIVHTCLHSSLL